MDSLWDAEQNEFEGFYSLTPVVDLVELLAPFVSSWLLHGTSFTEKRKATLLAKRLQPFYMGVRVVKQHDKYFILYWTKGVTNAE